MANRECEGCGQRLNLARSDARTCSTKCRVRVHRAAKRAAERAETARRSLCDALPAELRALDRWVRWEARRRASGVAKMPLTVAGRAASSTDPCTWTTYADAAASSTGDGIGFVLNGDGLACIDLDHCLTEGKPTAAAQRVLDMFPGAWVEVSPSGDGLHIWGTAQSAPGKGPKRTADGLTFEFYTRGRYMTVTGNTYRHGDLSTALHPDL